MEETKKRNRDMNSCNRCGGDAGIGFLRERISLGNVYEAILCVDCHSDWNLFCLRHETIKAIESNTAAMNVAYQQIAADGLNRLSQINELQEARSDIFEQMFGVAESWVNDRIEREKPEPVLPLTPEEILDHEKKYLARHEKRLAHLRKSIAAAESVKESDGNNNRSG